MLQIMSGQLHPDSDYVYIRHYMTTYQYVPLWILMNVLTIGQLSKIYANQKGRIQIRVCQDFGTLKVNEMGKCLRLWQNLEMSVLTMTNWYFHWHLTPFEQKNRTSSLQKHNCFYDSAFIICIVTITLILHKDWDAWIISYCAKIIYEE